MPFSSHDIESTGKIISVKCNNFAEGTTHNYEMIEFKKNCLKLRALDSDLIFHKLMS